MGVVMRKVCSLLFVLMAASSEANYSCTGKVEYLGASTQLSVSNGYGVHNLCNVSDEKCKLWVSLILSAKLADRGISIYYQSNSSDTGDQSDGVCNDIGNWVVPADSPYFVRIH